MYNVKKFLGFFACFLLSLGITDAADFLRICTTKDSDLTGIPSLNIHTYDDKDVISDNFFLPSPGECANTAIIKPFSYDLLAEKQLDLLISTAPGYFTHNKIGTVTYNGREDFANCYIGVYYGHYTIFSFEAKASLVCVGQ